jgi:hypothetical protein
VWVVARPDSNRTASGGGVLDHGVDGVAVDGTTFDLHLAARRDDDEGGLGGDAVFGEDLAERIGDLGEGQSELVDEPLEVLFIAVPGDADEVGPTGPPCTCLLDRGGFVPTGESTRRPEPQRDRLVVDDRQVETPTTHERESLTLGGRC